MIKKLLLAIMIALPMSVFAQKFAVINTQQLMESMPELKTVNEQLEAANKKYQDEFTPRKALSPQKAEMTQSPSPSKRQLNCASYNGHPLKITCLKARSSFSRRTTSATLPVEILPQQS